MLEFWPFSDSSAFDSRPSERDVVDTPSSEEDIADTPWCADLGYYCGEGGCDCDACCGTPWGAENQGCCNDAFCTCTAGDDGRWMCDCGGRTCYRDGYAHHHTDNYRTDCSYTGYFADPEPSPEGCSAADRDREDVVGDGCLSPSTPPVSLNRPPPRNRVVSYPRPNVTHCHDPHKPVASVQSVETFLACGLVYVDRPNFDPAWLAAARESALFLADQACRCDDQCRNWAKTESHAERLQPEAPYRRPEENDCHAFAINSAGRYDISPPFSHPAWGAAMVKVLRDNQALMSLVESVLGRDADLDFVSVLAAAPHGHAVPQEFHGEGRADSTTLKVQISLVNLTQHMGMIEIIHPAHLDEPNPDEVDPGFPVYMHSDLSVYSWGESQEQRKLVADDHIVKPEPAFHAGSLFGYRPFHLHRGSGNSGDRWKVVLDVMFVASGLESSDDTPQRWVNRKHHRDLRAEWRRQNPWRG